MASLLHEQETFCMFCDMDQWRIKPVYDTDTKTATNSPANTFSFLNGRVLFDSGGGVCSERLGHRVYQKVGTEFHVCLHSAASSG